MPLLRDRWPWPAFAAALAALLALAYGPGLEAPFYLDDTPNISDNQHLQLDRLSWDGLVAAATESPLPRRWFAYLSFAVDHWLWGGYQPSGFRAVNILIHGINALLVFALLRRTLALAAGGQARGHGRAAALAALLWAVHPIHIHSVTYIVQRMNSLAVLCYLLALLLYLRGRTAGGTGRAAGWFVAAGLTWWLALGSKEVAITLPFVVLLYELWFLARTRRARRLASATLALLGLAAAAGIVLAVAGLEPLAMVQEGYENRGFTLPERALTQPRVVMLYLQLLVFPHPSLLGLEHDAAVSRSLLEPPATLASLAIIAGLLAVAALSARRRPLLSLGIVWFLGHLVLESSILALELVFQHRTYLPSVGLALLAAAVLVAAWRSTGRLAPGARLGSAVAITGTGALLALWTAWNAERNALWAEPLAFWQDAVSKAPGSVRARNNLARALYDRGDEAAAMAELDRAVDVAKEGLARQTRKAPGAGTTMISRTYVNRARLHATQGDLEAALADFGRAIAAHPANTEALLARAELLIDRGRLAGAAADLDQVQLFEPDHVEAINLRARILQESGRLDAAKRAYTEMIARYPRNAAGHSNRGLVRMQLGDLEGAERDLQQAIALDAELAAAHGHLGNLRLRRGDLEGALRAYRRVLALDPEDHLAFANAGVVHYRLGRNASAAEALRRALALAPRAWPQRDKVQRLLDHIAGSSGDDPR